MTENQNPQDSTDDTEGHGVSSGRIVEDADSDVEGHGAYSNRIAEDADVEGHALRVKGLDSEPASDEDVEGHGVSSGRFRPDEDEMFGDDVQAHGFRGNVSEDE